MATPSSSGTSPSPAFSFTVPANGVGKVHRRVQWPGRVAEREECRRKILARTEFAKVTFFLVGRRTRVMAWAHRIRTVAAAILCHIFGPSFGACKHALKMRNTACVILWCGRDSMDKWRLHASSLLRGCSTSSRAKSPNQQAIVPSPSYITTFGGDKKRKAGNPLNNTVYYNSPLTQNHNMSGIGLRAKPPNAAKSLFASTLVLPPAKRARAIHNSEAPSVPPPPPHSQGRQKELKEGRAVDKGRRGEERDAKDAKGRGRANSISRIKTRFSGETEDGNDIDVKAAATLIDLLFSRSNGTASPRPLFSAPTSASRMAPAGPSVGAIPLSQTSSKSSVSARVNAHMRTGSNASISSTVTVPSRGGSGVFRPGEWALSYLPQARRVRAHYWLPLPPVRPRAPCVLLFSVRPDVQNTYLERGARRTLVGLFGEGWCTAEFSTLPQKTKDGLMRGLAKRTTPLNVFSLFFAAQAVLHRLGTLRGLWAELVRNMVLAACAAIDGVLCNDAEKCFAEQEWVDIMENDGLGRFEDGVRVKWVMDAAWRGMTESNAGLLYQASVVQAIVSSILLRPHPTKMNEALLSSTSHICAQVWMDTIRWLRRRWMGVLNLDSCPRRV
ncbi:hypothetical protein DFH11DRAFT_1830101 [Phellopilus nigrolimitatus]|nr:hypothetical protein DFH11DRAFT_1830101 [Phellopilus nigrolimitatus]